MSLVSGAEIAELLGLGPGASARARVSHVSGFDAATPESLVFAADRDALEQALATPAGLVLGPLDSRISADAGPRLLAVRDPRLAFAQVYARWFDRRGGGGVHPSATVEAGAQVGADCEIGPGAVILSGAVLGTSCVLGPRVIVFGCTRMGDRVRVQAGTVLGSDGFGYARDGAGYIGFPQIGTLRIGDDVEIGANCTIDRGALGETSIGRGTKIDNLVHVAHNCVLGEDVILAAQVGMAGSTVIEDHAMLGGQVGLGERVTIGKGVVLGGQGGVLPGKRLDGEGKVFWGTPARPVREYLRDLAAARGLGARRGKS